MLIDKFHLTQEQVAERLGKKRTTVANMLRLLNLPDDIQAEIASGMLSAGHAKALAGIEDEDQLREIVNRLREQAYTVRQTENWVRQIREKKSGKKSKHRSSSSLHDDPNLQFIEETIQDILGAKVRIQTKKQGSGKIEISYFQPG